jgi:hypothetical protein
MTLVKPSASLAARASKLWRGDVFDDALQKA